MEDELKYIFINERRPQTTQIENVRCSMIAGHITLWVKYEMLPSINVWLCKLTPSGWLS